MSRRVLLSLACLWAPLAAAEPLTLTQLIELARMKDGRVKSAESELRVLRGKYQEARWAWFPRIESTFAVAGPTPEARNDGLGGPPTTAATYMYDLDFGQPGVMLRAEAQGVLPIYTFGKLDALEALGAKGVEVGQALQVRAQDEAELQVAQAYWGLQFARAGKKSLEETLKRLDDADTTIKRLRAEQSEQVTQMDVYKVEFFREQARARGGSARAGESYALAAIRLLIDQPRGPLEVAEQDIPEPSGTLPPLESLLGQAVLSRPEVKAIDAGLGLRDREVFIRERMFLPDFGIAGFARWMWTTSTTRQRSPFAYDPYNDLSAGFALVGRYTWDFPIKAAQLEQARAEYEKLERERELLLNAIRLEVSKAHADLGDALERASHQVEAEKSSRRWATSAFAAFDVGTADTRELVDSFTALAVSSVEKGHAFHDVQVGLHSLTKAVGSPVALLPGPVKAPKSDALQPK